MQTIKRSMFVGLVLAIIAGCSKDSTRYPKKKAKVEKELYVFSEGRTIAKRTVHSMNGLEGFQVGAVVVESLPEGLRGEGLHEDTI